jgi:hypothetical protein
MGMTMVLEGDKTMWPDVPNDKQWYTLVQSCTQLKGVSLVCDCPNVPNSKQLYLSMFWPKVRCSSGLNIILFLIPLSLSQSKSYGWLAWLVYGV